MVSKSMTKNSRSGSIRVDFFLTGVPCITNLPSPSPLSRLFTASSSTQANWIPCARSSHGCPVLPTPRRQPLMPGPGPGPGRRRQRWRRHSGWECRPEATTPRNAVKMKYRIKKIHIAVRTNENTNNEQTWIVSRRRIVPSIVLRGRCDSPSAPPPRRSRRRTAKRPRSTRRGRAAAPSPRPARRLLRRRVNRLFNLQNQNQNSR